VLGDLAMAYETRTFGEQPRSLVISMHGGGGAPKTVNDRQWKNQISLYQLPEGIYVAPRAPTDTWNMWHQAHIDSFLTRLIENMVLFEGIDPDRVYLTGYSAGGDGVFQLAPRMADQLAAAAMMAGHPNETQPLGLRNLPFTLHVGGEDAAYNRNKIAAEWSEKLAKLRQEDPSGYEHWAKVYAGKGHWLDREEAAGVEWMLEFTRNIIPQRIVWLQDDVRHHRFYWLACDDSAAKAGDKIVAVRQENTITIEAAPPGKVTVLLRDDMLDMDQPIAIKFGEKVVFRGKVDRSLATLAQTLADRGDPNAMFSAQVAVDCGPKP
jgi:predicted esterase